MKRSSTLSIGAVALVLGIAACSDDTTAPSPDVGPEMLVPADASVDNTASADAGTDSAEADTIAADTVASDTVAPDTLPTVVGPLAYWSMDSVDITASTLADGVGDIDGTIVGASTDNQGKVNEALSFDGSSHVGLGDVLDDVFAGADKAFSMAMWVKPAGLGYVTLMAKTGDTACDPQEDQRQLMLALTLEGKVSFVFQTLVFGNAQMVSTENAAVTVGQWSHVVVAYDGSVDTAPEDRLTIYVDGVSVSLTGVSLGSFPYDLPDSSAHLGLGVRLDSSGNACTASGAGTFEGSMDEVAIWDRVLDAAEAKAVYDGGVAGQRLVP